MADDDAFEGLADIQPDVVAATAPAPAPPPVPAPAPALATAPAHALAKDKGKAKEAPRFRKLYQLTTRERIESGLIQQLFWTADGIHLLSLPCPKPE